MISQGDDAFAGDDVEAKRMLHRPRMKDRIT